jgi:TolB-like protein/Tfp pilus assembly protein PilF
LARLEASYLLWHSCCPAWGESIISPTKFRFADFEFDVKACDLRQNGRSIKLERRPMDLLQMLLERHGEMVSRDEIVARLWGSKVFVDADLGINTAVRKVRQILKDDPQSHRFVETVSGRGYRFVASVTVENGSAVKLVERLTLAVLPFEDLGKDPDREYVADGLTEEAIAAIGRIDPDRLGVISRTSINRYKKTTKTASEIGAELNATYLLESTVRAEGERLRITCRLVTVHDQSQMWSASYESEPNSVLALQRELSSVIAQQIQLRLLPERISTLAYRQTENADAYDLYLRGRYYWNQLTPVTTKRALDCYRQATTLDPTYALAWSGLADAYSSSAITSDAPPRQMLPLAREAATQAVRYAEKLSESQVSRGFYNLFLTWKWSVAEEAFRSAVELDGNNPLAHRMLGVVLSHMARHKEAMDSMRRARELDPLYVMHHALSTLVSFHAGDFETALEFGKQAIVVDPDFWIGYHMIAQVYEQLGKYELALEAIKQAGKLGHGNSKTFGLRGFILARMGKTSEAREVIQTLQSISKERYVPPYAMALIHAGLNESEKTFEWLERALEVRDVHLIFTPVDPKWDAIRDDARFKNLVKRCELG